MFVLKQQSFIVFYFNDLLAYVFLHSQEFHKIGVFNVNLLDIRNFLKETLMQTIKTEFIYF